MPETVAPPPSTELPRNEKSSVLPANSAALSKVPSSQLPSASRPTVFPFTVPAAAPTHVPLLVWSKPARLQSVLSMQRRVGSREQVPGVKLAVKTPAVPAKLMPRPMRPEMEFPRTVLSPDRKLNATPLFCFSRHVPFPVQSPFTRHGVLGSRVQVAPTPRSVIVLPSIRL